MPRHDYPPEYDDLGEEFYRDRAASMSRLDLSISVCEDCLEPCEGVFEDMGIGSYEFHGQRGNDVNIQYVSKCCGAPVWTAGSLDEGPSYGPDAD